MDRRGLDRRRHRRARRQVELVARAACDERVQRKPAVERHTIDWSLGGNGDDACGEVIAGTAPRSGTGFDRDILRPNTYIYLGAGRQRIALGDMEDDVSDGDFNQAAG